MGVKSKEADCFEIVMESSILSPSPCMSPVEKKIEQGFQVLDNPIVVFSTWTF